MFEIFMCVSLGFVGLIVCFALIGGLAKYVK